jgi:catechol 2,3-dioxygenase-like lactoylglutathione lyase family enzyme
MALRSRRRSGWRSSTRFPFVQPLTVLETSLYSDDLAAAEAFYGDVLDLPLHSRQAGRHVFFRCGDAMLLLFDPAATALEAGDVPTHGATGPGHAAFSVGDDDLEVWRAKLEERGVEIEASIEWPNGGRSIYFRDPAGNSLELITRRAWGIR